MSRNVSRRSILAGGGAIAAAGSVALPVLAASATMGEDAHLVELWRRLLEAHAAYERLKDMETAAVLRMPEWARWGGRNERGTAICAPEWTASMLAEHGIPASMGRRPSGDDIDRLNRDRLSAAEDAFMPPDFDLFAVPLNEWKAMRAKIGKRPEVQAVQKANARRKAAYEARREEQRAEEWRAGLDELDDAQERAGDVLFSIADEIENDEARTLLGIVLKLRVWSLSVLDWGFTAPEDLDCDERSVMAVLEGLERLLPADVLKTIPPIPLRRWDRPDAAPAKEVANAA